MMKDRTMIDWFQHPKLLECDDFVEEYMDKGCKDSWNIISGARCLENFKYEADKWIQNRIEVLQELQEMLDELPDDTNQEYWLNKDDSVEVVGDE